MKLTRVYERNLRYGQHVAYVLRYVINENGRKVRKKFFVKILIKSHDINNVAREKVKVKGKFSGKIFERYISLKYKESIKERGFNGFAFTHEFRGIGYEPFRFLVFRLRRDDEL